MKDRDIEEIKRNKRQVLFSVIFSLILGVTLLIISYTNCNSSNIQNGLIILYVIMGIIGAFSILYALAIIIREIQLRR